jgi:hypothetical protein
VSNPNGQSLLVDIDGVDAHTAATTGAAYSPPGTAATHTGAWLTLTTRQVQLASGEHRIVAFGVRVPLGTPPGQYLAGISVAVPLSGQPDAPTLGAHAAGFSLALQAQRVIGVEVDVPGPMAPALTVSGARPGAGNNGLSVFVSVANRGNAFAHGRGVLTVGDTNTRATFTINTFVPGTNVDLAVPWSKTVVPGHHDVTVRLLYDGGRVTTWSGSFDIGSALQQQLEQQLHVASATPASKGSGLPAGWIALGLIVVTAAIALHLRRRRSHPPQPFGRGLPLAVGARRDS